MSDLSKFKICDCSESNCSLEHKTKVCSLCKTRNVKYSCFDLCSGCHSRALAKAEKKTAEVTHEIVTDELTCEEGITADVISGAARSNGATTSSTTIKKPNVLHISPFFEKSCWSPAEAANVPEPKTATLLPTKCIITHCSSYGYVAGTKCHRCANRLCHCMKCNKSPNNRQWKTCFDCNTKLPHKMNRFYGYNKFCRECNAKRLLRRQSLTLESSFETPNVSNLNVAYLSGLSNQTNCNSTNQTNCNSTSSSTTGHSANNDSLISKSPNHDHSNSSPLPHQHDTIYHPTYYVPTLVPYDQHFNPINYLHPQLPGLGIVTVPNIGQQPQSMSRSEQPEQLQSAQSVVHVVSAPASSIIPSTAIAATSAATVPSSSAIGMPVMSIIPQQTMYQQPMHPQAVASMYWMPHVQTQPVTHQQQQLLTHPQQYTLVQSAVEETHPTTILVEENVSNFVPSNDVVIPIVDHL